MVQAADFDPAVPLPAGLDISAIRRAIEYIEKELADLVELYIEQANVFSALVGMFGTKALSQYSQFEKHKHPDVAAQRFPDLCRRGRRRSNAHLRRERTRQETQRNRRLQTQGYRRQGRQAGSRQRRLINPRLQAGGFAGASNGIRLDAPA